MPRWKRPVTQPIRVELGDADLRLESGRDLYPIVFAGTEVTGLEYSPEMYYPYGLAHSGMLQSLNGDLLVEFPGGAGAEDPGDGEPIKVGGAKADYFTDDRILVLTSSIDPRDRPEAEQVELAALFEQFARTHYPDAAKVYRLETILMPESVLHALGYHLAFTVRRRSGGRRLIGSPRVWTR